MYGPNNPPPGRSKGVVNKVTKDLKEGVLTAATNIGRDGNGADYCGGSVAIDFLGQPLSDEHDGDDVETIVLDREALAAFRTSFPVHLDADDFELRSGAERTAST